MEKRQPAVALEIATQTGSQPAAPLRSRLEPANWFGPVSYASRSFI